MSSISDSHLTKSVASSDSSLLRPACAKAHTGAIPNHPRHPKKAASTTGIHTPKPPPGLSKVIPKGVLSTNPLIPQPRNANITAATIRAQTGGMSFFLSSSDCRLNTSLARISSSFFVRTPEASGGREAMSSYFSPYSTQPASNSLNTASTS